jgi:hypothetical protein
MALTTDEDFCAFLFQGRCASGSPRMRPGAALFRIPSGDSGGSNPMRNCNFNPRRV